MKTLGNIIFILGLIILAITTVSSLGYGLYLWAYTMTFALAAWTAFLLWLKMFGGGLVMIFVGAII